MIRLHVPLGDIAQKKHTVNSGAVPFGWIGAAQDQSSSQIIWHETVGKWWVIDDALTHPV